MMQTVDEIELKTSKNGKIGKPKKKSKKAKQIAHHLGTVPQSDAAAASPLSLLLLLLPPGGSKAPSNHQRSRTEARRKLPREIDRCRERRERERESFYFVGGFNDFFLRGGLYVALLSWPGLAGGPHLQALAGMGPTVYAVTALWGPWIVGAICQWVKSGKGNYGIAPLYDSRSLRNVCWGLGAGESGFVGSLFRWKFES